MERARVVFTVGRNPLSALIRAVTWSQWSHVALVVRDATGVEWVVDSTLQHGGVRRRPLSVLLAGSKAYTFVDFPVADATAVVDAAVREVGKPYDWTALFGLWFKRDWQDPSDWFCSELVAYALQAGGAHLFRRDRVSRVTPEHLWMVSPE